MKVETIGDCTLTAEDVAALKRVAMIANAAAKDIKDSSLRLETLLIIKAACAAIRKVEPK